MPLSFKLPAFRFDHVRITGAHLIIMPEVPVQLGAVVFGKQLGIEFFRMLQALVDFDEYPGAGCLERVPGSMDKVRRYKKTTVVLRMTCRSARLPCKARPPLQSSSYWDRCEVNKQFRLGGYGRVADIAPVYCAPVYKVEVAAVNGLVVHARDYRPVNRIFPGVII